MYIPAHSGVYAEEEKSKKKSEAKTQQPEIHKNWWW
jgi:hypothetical protein